MSNLIQIRAAITPAEWKRIRKMAVDQSRPTAELVASLIRAGLAA